MVYSPPPVPVGKGASKFDGKLSRDFVLLIVIMSLLPLFLVGAATYYRSRQLLRNQAVAQLEIITKVQVNELEHMATYSQALVERIITDEGLRSAIDSALADPEKLHKRALVAWQLDRYCSISQSDSGFHTLALFLPDRTMLAATDNIWRTADVSDNHIVDMLLATNQSIALYNPKPFYPDQIAVFTAFTIPDHKGEIAATLIGTQISDLPRSGLVSASAFFIGARAFYQTKDNISLGIDQQGEHFSLIDLDTHQTEHLRELMTGNPSGFLKEYRSSSGEGILSYARWIPGLQMGLVLEVPLNTIYQQLNILTPINTAIFIVTMLLSAGIVYLVSRQVVRPLLTLVDHARRFSEGDWSQRANINRKDEIGLLAHTFNGMVEQLSNLYHSLEMKVNERSRQIRLALEIGQIATSTHDRNEVIQRTAALVVERFDYAYAAVYLVEESGLYAVLKEESQVGPGLQSYAGARLRIGSDSLIGWVVSSNQARVIANIENEKFTRQFIQVGVRSEVAIPIAIGNLVYGVLDVQSNSSNTFDSDAVAVLQTLANHISSGLQNLHLLETAQVNLQETALLYRASRQISQASNDREVIRLMTNALKETPFVSGLYAIHSDHISVIAINDPKEPGGQATSEGITIPLKNIPVLLQEPRPILINDIRKPSEFDHILSFYTRRGCQSAAIIPLFEDQILAKMVVLSAPENQKFTETTLQPYTNLLSVGATTLGQFRILKTLQHRVNELQLLTEVSHEISLHAEPDQLFRSLQNQVEKIVGGECEFTIAVYHPETNEIEVPFSTAMNETHRKLLSVTDDDLIAYILHSGKPLLINGDTPITNDLGIRSLGKQSKSWLGIPLSAGRNTIGALILRDTVTQDRFNEEHLSILSTLSPQIATAIRNAQLIQETEKALSAYDHERSLLTTLLENIPDQVYIKDIDGHYVRVSHSYANQFDGSMPEDLIRQTDISLMGYEVGMPIYKTEQELMSTGIRQIGSIENQTGENGEEIWRLISRIPLMDEDNHSTGLLAISRDISTLMRAEERAKRNAHLLRTAAEIARDTSATLDIRDLLRKAVNLVRERFGFYHASIFLMNPSGEFAVLEESTGIAGQQMKDSQHKLSRGSNSIIGQVTQTGEPLVINDVSQSTIYYANPLLPDTRAELAIPLKISNQVLGAVDVQSNRQNIFSEQDIAILQILADQISVAVYNSKLFARTQENINRHRMLHEITTATSMALTAEDVLHTAVESLHAAMPDDRVSIFILENGRIELRSSAGPEADQLTSIETTSSQWIVARTVQARKAIQSTVTDLSGNPFKSQLAVPIIYSRNVVGALMVESPHRDAYDEFDQEIMSTLGNSIGPILYNAYLMAEVRLQVERERLIYDATSRIHRSVDIQTILKTSAAEIAKAVGARSAQIELLHKPENNGQSEEIAA
jgi:PAS domain S-box-containing protein